MSTVSPFRRRLISSIKPKAPNYLCFTALESGTFTLTINSNLGTAYFTYASYSINDTKSWVRLDNVNSQAVSITTPTLNAGDKVYWKGYGNRTIGTISSGNTNGVVFSSTCKFNASGELSSLCKEVAKRETVARDRAYGNLFNACVNLVDASELILPFFTGNSQYVFYALFYGCTGLTKSPVLDNENLSNGCYASMFSGCSSIDVTPKLDCITLKNACFQNMFYGCTGLTTVQNLPATSIPESAYESMFQNCTSLVNVPDVYVSQFGGNIAMRYMFKNCTALTHCPFKQLPSVLTSGCMRELFYGCTSLLDICELPALTLTAQCYLGLLRNTKVSWIKMLATDISAGSCLENWIYGVPNVNTSVFVKHIDAQWTTTGYSGVPTNWKVIYYDPTADKYYTDKTKATECDDHGNPI